MYVLDEFNRKYPAPGVVSPSASQTLPFLSVSEVLLPVKSISRVTSSPGSPPPPEDLTLMP